MSLKLIQDPSTGKPRGFGFCEYEDPDTAMSACRNLAGRELNGRPLRIDSAMNAPGENIKSTINVPIGPVEPPVHGQPVPPEAAPEAITKAVASLPPEQMFELMKQMKWCIQYNPNETRQLLLHNPQLAYALLQAQVVMKIVDLDTAQKLLHRTPRGQPLQMESHPPPPPHREPPHREPPPRREIPPHRDTPHPSGPSSRFGHTPPGGGGWYRDGPHSSRGPPSQSRGLSPHSGPGFHHGSPSSDVPPDQERMLVQLLNLSDEQIHLLPADQRSKILHLKQQIAQSRP